MRLKQYITEVVTTDIDEYLPILEKECAPYLKECKKAGGFLYRAINDSFSIKKMKPRSDRRPRDTPIELHNFMDDYFKKNFGWKARSEGVFVSSDFSYISEYASHVHMFFPIGKFKYVWSKHVSDIFIIFREHEIIDINDNEMNGDISDHEDTLIDVLRHYQNNNLYSAIVAGNEVMVKCKEYYLINMKYKFVMESLLS